MNERFFYKYANEIKELFKKHGVSRCQIQRGGQYFSLFLDVGTDQNLASKRRLNLQEDMLKLAVSRNEVVNLNYLYYELAADTTLPAKPIDFKVFLAQGLLQMAHQGYGPEVTSLLAADVDVNFQDSQQKKSALLLALTALIEAYKELDTHDAEFKKLVIENMDQLKKVIYTLINSPDINCNLQINNLQTDLTTVIVNLLPSQVTPNDINELAVQAQKIIGETLQLLQNKGIEINGEILREHGYPLIFDMLRKNTERAIQSVSAEDNNSTKVVEALAQLSVLRISRVTSPPIAKEQSFSEKIDAELLAELKKKLEEVVLGLSTLHQVDPLVLLDCFPRIVKEMRTSPHLSPPKSGMQL